MSKIKAGSKSRYKPTQDELWQIASIAVQMRDKLFPKVYQFINNHTSIPAPVMIETLKSVAKYQPKEPWAYGKRVMAILERDFNAGKNIEEHERLKKEPLAIGNIMAEIAKRAMKE